MGPNTTRLVQRVERRLALRSALLRVRLFALLLGGLYAACLIATRLLGLLPDRLTPLTLATLAAGAAALAVAFHRRPGPAQAARAIDLSCGTKDLYLTAALIESAAGEYQPLVLASAESRAGDVRAEGVAPLRWVRPLGHAAAVICLLLAGVLWLPQLDPFGSRKAQQEREVRRKELEQMRAVSLRRAEALRQRNVEARHSERVAAAVEDLKTAFRSMDKDTPQANLSRLKDSQTKLGELWKNTGDKQLTEALKAMSSAQLFGANAAKFERWRKQLQEGDNSGLKEEMDRLKEDAKKLAEMPEGADKQELARSIQKRLEDLNDFASNVMNNQAMSSAARRAMEQLAMSGLPELSRDALQGLQDRTDQMNLEAAAQAQGIRDLKQLEQAMAACRAAAAANQKCPLDGSQLAQGQALSDYEKLYREMAQEGKTGGEGQGTGQGGMPAAGTGGTGGEGQGRGGRPPEAPSATAFKSQTSPAALQAGKMLLEWKFRTVSPGGATEEEYRKQLQVLKEAYSEAVTKEEIPPSYREEIKRYFDTLGQGAKERKDE